MKNSLRTASVCLFASLALSFAACVPPSNSNTTNNSAPTNTATTTASPALTPTPASRASTDYIPVTLPVLDAMFADEAFAGQLKQNVQLTDEQITRLRQIAREETSKLRETETGEHTGSTAQAREHAAEQIRGVVGQDKFEQFSNFVRERWTTGGEAADASGAGAPSGGGAASAANRPNSVPTDTRVVVNAPAYRMDVFRDGQLVKSYRVGIGYPEFPLPTGLRRASTIIFNPTWTPPDEPWVESSGNLRPGQTVEAGSKLNPLGPVKIPIGSPSLIHGGKSPAKLGSFASHGCVGLTNPQVLDFSRVLAEMSGTELTPEQIAEYGKNKSETKNVKLSNAVPVELRYETIVVEDGKLHIYRDVYDRDTNTEENLRAVLAAYDVNYDQLSDQEKTQLRQALEQMSRDASGRSDAQSAPQNGNANQNANSAQGNRNGNNANTNNSNGNRVTRAVKGKKEIVIELAALQGKGYPAPANLDTGSGTTKKAGATAPSGNRRR